MKPSSSSTPGAPTSATIDLHSLTIRELTARYPETMPVLAPFGIDLCCGGAHTVADALAIHGADTEAVLDQIDELIRARPERR